MKAKYLIPLISFLALAALLLSGLYRSGGREELPSPFIGKPAPTFELPVLGTTDQTFKPADYQGKRWILNVWASWCASCRDEHPLLNAIAANTDIPLVGLNYKDKPEDAKQWLAQRGNPYQSIPADEKGSAGIDWGVYAVPETFIIDESGTVVYKHIGPINAQILATEFTPFFPEIRALFQSSPTEQ